MNDKKLYRKASIVIFYTMLISFIACLAMTMLANAGVISGDIGIYASASLALGLFLVGTSIFSALEGSDIVVE